MKNLFLCLFCLASTGSLAYQLTPRLEGGIRYPLEVQWDRSNPKLIYIVEQAGRIRTARVGKDGNFTLLKSNLIDIRSKVNFGGEKGLLSLALHPSFQKNKKFYVNYTASRGLRPTQVKTIIEEYQVGKKNGRKLLEFNQPWANHNGGQLAFGPDGYLYIATGDGGAAGDPQGNGQKKSNLLGKILRIDVDQRSKNLAYGIPKNNPFINEKGTRKEIFAYGLRNPWRFSFDGKKIYAADVGQNAWEEVNVIESGKNYGWKVLEGNHCFEPQENCNRKDLTPPIYEYPHPQGLSITGGFVYRGKNLKKLTGHYVFGDFVSGFIRSLALKKGTWKIQELMKKSGKAICGFGQHPNGELLVIDHRGAIFELSL